MNTRRCVLWPNGGTPPMACEALPGSGAEPQVVYFSDDHHCSRDRREAAEARS